VPGLLLGRPAQVQFVDGMTLRVGSLMDLWVAKETILDRDYETHGQPIQDGWVIFDIGAASGDFAVSVARRFPRAVVHAFEPFPAAVERMQATIAANDVRNVTVHNAAIGAHTGTLQLRETGQNVQHTTTQSTLQGEAAGTLTVQALSLPDALARAGVQAVDLVKMDCEGAEFDILLSAAPDALRNIKRICMEYHDIVEGRHHAQLVEHLRSSGFTVATHSNPVHGYLGFIFGHRV
jgi:FkbM family methyltransferase